MDSRFFYKSYDDLSKGPTDRFRLLLAIIRLLMEGSNSSRGQGQCMVLYQTHITGVLYVPDLYCNLIRVYRYMNQCGRLDFSKHTVTLIATSGETMAYEANTFC